MGGKGLASRRRPFDHSAAFLILLTLRTQALPSACSTTTVIRAAGACRSSRSSPAFWSSISFGGRRVPTTAYSAALALLLAGIAGNLTDRLRLGYVIDFIDVQFGAWHYPTFNIADSAIVIGAGLMILDMVLSRRSQKSEVSSQKGEG